MNDAGVSVEELDTPALLVDLNSDRRIKQRLMTVQIPIELPL